MHLSSCWLFLRVLATFQKGNSFKSGKMPKMNGKTSITLRVDVRFGWFLIPHVALDCSTIRPTQSSCSDVSFLNRWSVEVFQIKSGGGDEVCVGVQKCRLQNWNLCNFLESRLESIRTMTRGWIAKQTVKQIRILIQRHFTNLRSTDICWWFSWGLIVPPWGLSSALVAVPQKP